MIAALVELHGDGANTACQPAPRRPLAGSRITSTKAVVGAQGCVLVHSRHHDHRRGVHRFATGEPTCGSSQSKSSGVIHHCDAIVVAPPPHDIATLCVALVAWEFSDTDGRT